MPQFSGSFQQLSVWFNAINAGPAATSAQANWVAGASEAQQLADELTRSMGQLQQFWTGPAATEFYNTMTKIIEYAQKLSIDMTSMGTGLAQMAATAQAIQPGALALIAAASSNPYSRAAAIAPLNAMINQLGGAYLQARSTHWKEPSSDPQRLPKPDNVSVDNPRVLDNPGTVDGTSLLDRINEVLKIIKAAANVYRAFKEADFVSNDSDFDLPPIDGALPPPSISPPPGLGGPGGGFPGNNPDYQPVPLPDPSLITPGETGLAGAPAGAPPAVSLAAGGPTPLSAPGGGGAMPMGMGGMGMGMAGGGGGSGPMSSAKGSPLSGNGMFPGMMGAGSRGNKDEEDSGTHTWLTEDDMVWNGDAAPGGVVGK
ncbi:WXG100 family type VII secretion target [Stackebrandtia soli]|uniref:WXG100 family type VII secretion target n=1 Tax=Stackebrandtia soli TaxID=1892856 RepID=UPI0039E7D92C